MVSLQRYASSRRAVRAQEGTLRPGLTGTGTHTGRIGWIVIREGTMIDIRTVGTRSREVIMIGGTATTAGRRRTEIGEITAMATTGIEMIAGMIEITEVTVVITVTVTTDNGTISTGSMTLYEAQVQNKQSTRCHANSAILESQLPVSTSCLFKIESKNI